MCPLSRKGWRSGLAASMWLICFGSAWSGEQPQKLPPLVNHATQLQGLPVPRLSEPVPNLPLPLAQEPRLLAPRPRIAPPVRPLPESVSPVWTSLDGLPQRPDIPAGPKVYVAASNATPVLPLRWLREQPIGETADAQTFDRLWTESVRRRVEYWREQPASCEPACIPDCNVLSRHSRFEESAREVPLLQPSFSRPASPPLPVSPSVK